MVIILLGVAMKSGYHQKKSRIFDVFSCIALPSRLSIWYDLNVGMYFLRQETLDVYTTFFVAKFSLVPLLIFSRLTDRLGVSTNVSGIFGSYITWIGRFRPYLSKYQQNVNFFIVWFSVFIQKSNISLSQ